MLPPATSLAGGFSAQYAESQSKNFTSEELLHFSKKVEKSLAKEGAMVAIVGRIGVPKKSLPEGVNYTHVAFWVYSTIKTADGRSVAGYQVYNLYQQNNNPTRSQLATDFPVNFFAGSDSLDAGIIIPKASLQNKLLHVMTSDTYRELHQPNYSIVANPSNLDYQNCTEFVLDVLVSAIYNTNNPHQIKANIAQYFIPQEIRISAIKGLFGPLFMQEFKTSDQPNGHIFTTTFGSIADFMRHYKLSTKQYRITNV